MHLQTTVPNWTNALVKMPDYSLLKAVDDPAILLDGIDKWAAAGRDPNKLYLDYRHVKLEYPNWDQEDFSAWSFEDFKELWRRNFFKFIDGTYLQRYAPYVKYVEEFNEYTDTRMITDKELLAPRITSARAAVDVWNNEFRGKEVNSPDGGHGFIPSDARLVVCNSPVGNDIPIEYYRLCANEDAVLGARTYTKWIYGSRDPEDFRWHSGRPFFNEEAYGIKVNYLLGETGPYYSVYDGWRHEKCMGGSRDLLIDGMRQWVRDLSTTSAYQEGRILGPGAWFTCKNPAEDEAWRDYLLWESELVPLAEMMAQEWRPGTHVPPPEPPIEPPVEPPSECELNHVVVVNLIDQNITDLEYLEVRDRTKDRKETILQSADDAAFLVSAGKPGSKVKVWEPGRWQDDIDAWLRDRGVEQIEHLFF